MLKDRIISNKSDNSNIDHRNAIRVNNYFINDSYNFISYSNDINCYDYKQSVNNINCIKEILPKDYIYYNNDDDDDDVNYDKDDHHNDDHGIKNGDNDDVDDDNEGNNNNNWRIRKSIIAIQSIFRGKKIREKLKTAIESIRYDDKELDELLLYNTDDFDFINDDHNDFDDDYDHKNVRNNHGNNNIDNNITSISLSSGFLSSAASGLSSDILATSTMVYGDHIRKRHFRGGDNNITNNNNANNDNTQSSSNYSWLVPPPTTTNASANISNNNIATMKVVEKDNINTEFTEYSPYLIETARPSTTMTTTSTITACSSNSTYNDDDNDNVNDDIQILSYRSRCSRESTSLSQDNHHNHYNNQDLPDLSSHSFNNTVRQQHQQQQLSSSAATLLAQEWGITDPKVLAVMLKRNQRLK